MRLPGTRYQEHGWEEVRKLLGRAFLDAFARSDPALLLDPDQEADQLALYTDLVSETLHAGARSSRAQAAGNSYGESVSELALSLLFELQARRPDWSAFRAAVAGEHARLGPFWHAPGGDAILRKKVNDMFAVLRDKVDSDNYQVACGRPCSPNRMYGYRMLDTAYSDIARLFGDWEAHREQVGAILGREVNAMPIEARQMKSIALCKPEWVMGWSGSLEHFGAGPGPLHTRSKRFAALKDNPERIAEMMAEIGDYEELSSNRDQEWLSDASEAGQWMEDLWRVLDAPANEEPDRLVAADPPEEPEDVAPDPAPDDGSDAERFAATSLSLPPRFMQLARAAQQVDSWSGRLLAAESMAVRLAVYLKMLGPADETYPADWRDPATGELPTMAQLAVLDGVSLPTLRKRRDAAIARLQAAVPQKENER
ncbi:hypothetical protein KY495_22305 [Massilia sp. PAMC28688]|uniref:hypothetical protein n=1 Tax=Massilia sp. PAMC28688 TaxID=2861283 RepID=UPI001C633FC9|nr:hypothetical protein [Massilia sp. PAMC28688]QYF93369.1 hypothetical protein KY495_22305 [Massilia sp. PAMC28688]